MMKLKITMSDAAYQQLMTNGKRLQGTIGLINPTEVDFNVHSRAWENANHNKGKYKKLAHGRVSVNRERVRLTLCIDRTEEVLPEEIIDNESGNASEYVSEVIEEVWKYSYGFNG